MIAKLFVVSDLNIGDAVCAMGAVQFIADTCHHVFVWAENFDVAICMRPANQWNTDQVPEFSRMDVIHLSIARSLGEHGRRAHPIQQYLWQAGVRHERVPQPHFGVLGTFNSATSRVELEAPIYDYLIAPWSLDLRRVWPSENYPALFYTLRELQPDCRIGIIGALNDPRPWNDVDYVYGYGLSYVVKMMQTCRRAVITIDSGPNRLAHAANITNHVILSPTCYPDFWVTHPTAVDVRGTPQTWNVDAIMNALERLDTWKHPPPLKVS